MFEIQWKVLSAKESKRKKMYKIARECALFKI